MALILGSQPVGYVQNISSGGTADGTAPLGAVTYPSPGFKNYDATAVGGLFLFPENKLHKALTFLGYEFLLGGQTVWTLAITDGITNTSGNDIPIAVGTTDASVISPAILSIILLPGQGLRFTTTGTASSAWRLVIKVANSMSEGGLWI